MKFNLLAISLLHSIVNKNSSFCSVSVSVCTIKGAESRLLELGRVADISGGQVYNVTLFGHWINIMNLAVLQPVY